MIVTSHCTDTKWPGIKEVPLSQFSYMIGQYKLYEDAWMTVLQKNMIAYKYTHQRTTRLSWSESRFMFGIIGAILERHFIYIKFVVWS